MSGNANSALIRRQVDHPIVDGDGHTIEFGPLLEDYLRKVGGAKLAERYARQFRDNRLGWYALTPEERRARRITRPPFWTMPAKNTRDIATVMFPRLFEERMEALGLDYSIIYPTIGLFMPREYDAEVRQASCRALNMMHADIFGPYGRRMTPAAAIPMHTPEEAVAEMEFASKELGYKVMMIAGHVRRPIKTIAERAPDLAQLALWVDNLALDSDHDYDPVWRKCLELGVSPTAHTGSMGWGSRTSISNYNYNHIGHFAAANEAFCKALFFGGVTRRFPTLKFGLLEGGVGWATGLYADLVGHWEKRNAKALDRLDPANLDLKLFGELARKYGDARFREKLELATSSDGWLARSREDRTSLDEWAACRIERAEDIRDLFITNFYFGCEADDPSVAGAFDSKGNPFGARLNAIFSSDAGHWDVHDISEVVEEAYELVEHERITPADFRDFTFTNIVHLHTANNPAFFDGTAIEGDVGKLLGRSAQVAQSEMKRAS